MEWQPTFGCISTQQIALIQLAVSEQVFLLDTRANGFCQHPDTVNFIRSLFSEKNLLKLGKQQTGKKSHQIHWRHFCLYICL